MKVRNRILNIALGITLVLFIISFSIAFPILFRPIHTWCISPMHVREDLNDFFGTTFTFNDIKVAYDDILNFCVFYTPFKAGKLTYPIEDMMHFADCRVLFTLDLTVMLVTLVLLVTALVLKLKIKSIKFSKNTFLISGLVSVILPIFLLIVSAIDFDKAFTVFHHIFFPGKENWVFDPNVSQIIWIFPEGFFLVCVIIIAAFIILLSAGCIVTYILMNKKEKLLLKNQEVNN